MVLQLQKQLEQPLSGSDGDEDSVPVDVRADLHPKKRKERKNPSIPHSPREHRVVLDGRLELRGFQRPQGC